MLKLVLSKNIVNLVDGVLRLIKVTVKKKKKKKKKTVLCCLFQAQEGSLRKIPDSKILYRELLGVVE